MIQQETADNLFERQNDELVDALAERVNLLKQVSIDIHNEAKGQNEFLAHMVCSITPASRSSQLCLALRRTT